MEGWSDDDDDDDIHGTSEINPVIYGELENIKKLVESYIVRRQSVEKCLYIKRYSQSFITSRFCNL